MTKPLTPTNYALYAAIGKDRSLHWLGNFPDEDSAREHIRSEFEYDQDNLFIPFVLVPFPDEPPAAVGTVIPDYYHLAQGLELEHREPYYWEIMYG